MCKLPELKQLNDGDIHAFLGVLGDFKVVPLTGPTKPCATGVWWDGMGIWSNDQRLS